MTITQKWHGAWYSFQLSLINRSLGSWQQCFHFVKETWEAQIENFPKDMQLATRGVTVADGIQLAYTVQGWALDPGSASGPKT